MKFGSIKSKISEKLKKLALKKKLPKKTVIKPRVEKQVIRDVLRELSSPKIKERRFAILGIGNDLKGDDGIGWYVVDKLRKELKKDENLLLVKTSVPENHVKEISDFTPNMLIIIDSADFKKSPGEIKTIKGYQISESFISTHTTPLTLFLRLYQADQSFKKPFILIGIQRKSNEFGQPMSRPVKKAGDKLAKIILKLHGKGILDLSLEKELVYLSNPFLKILSSLRFPKKKK
ncbi:MAG: hydrogenase maturation protease [Candidatus Aenigmarchaeota archaeon]|nr:hydrogenase maturation protease [Candidatus Aenigmarchaeota archaeon]